MKEITPEMIKAYEKTQEVLRIEILPVAQKALDDAVGEGEVMVHGDETKPALYVKVPGDTPEENVGKFVSDTNEALASRGSKLVTLHGRIRSDDGTDSYEYEVINPEGTA